MSIRPVDYQIAVNQVGKFSKDASQIRSKPDTEQLQYTQEMQKEIMQEEKKTPSTNKAEHGRISREDDRGNSRERDKQGSRQVKQSKPDKGCCGQKSQESRIDIRV